MYRFFEQLSSRITAPFVGESKRNSKVWQCTCGQSVFSLILNAWPVLQRWAICLSRAASLRSKQGLSPPPGA